MAPDGAVHDGNYGRKAAEVEKQEAGELKSLKKVRTATVMESTKQCREASRDFLMERSRMVWSIRHGILTL